MNSTQLKGQLRKGALENEKFWFLFFIRVPIKTNYLANSALPETKT